MQHLGTIRSDRLAPLPFSPAFTENADRGEIIALPYQPDPQVLETVIAAACNAHSIKKVAKTLDSQRQLFYKYFVMFTKL